MGKRWWNQCLERPKFCPISVQISPINVWNDAELISYRGSVKACDLEGEWNFSGREVGSDGHFELIQS